MKPEIDMELLERTVNEFLRGLTMYVRDVDLNPKLSAIYKPGLIIVEKGFTDASNRVMGMVTSHRFAILSNHMADLREYENNTNWGLFVAKNNSFFKVLDVYEYQGKTQILLLHLPDDNRWALFQNVKLSIEDDMISDCRKRFEDKCMGEVVPELAAEAWINRCKFPLGMDEEGKIGIFFEKNEKSEENEKK